MPPPDRLVDFYEGYFNRFPEGINTVPTWKRMKNLGRPIATCRPQRRTGFGYATDDHIALKEGQSWGPADLCGAVRVVAALPHPANRFRADDNLAEVVPQLLPALKAWLAN